MFKLDMASIRNSAGDAWLTAIPANPAKTGGSVANRPAEISQKTPKLATIAKLAISHESAEIVAARLLAAAMRRCDQFGDSKEARDAMSADCLATPVQLRADLLEHFLKEAAMSGITAQATKEKCQPGHGALDRSGKASQSSTSPQLHQQDNQSGVV